MRDKIVKLVKLSKLLRDLITRTLLFNSFIVIHYIATIAIFKLGLPFDPIEYNGQQ